VPAKKKGQGITARLIVRRVRDLNCQASRDQGGLFPAWRYHAVLTDSPFEMIQAEAQHRATPSSSRSSPKLMSAVSGSGLVSCVYGAGLASGGRARPVGDAGQQHSAGSWILGRPGRYLITEAEGRQRAVI
jgi:hypothetical protein